MPTRNREPPDVVRTRTKDSRWSIQNHTRNRGRRVRQRSIGVSITALSAAVMGRRRQHPKDWPGSARAGERGGAVKAVMRIKENSSGDGEVHAVVPFHQNGNVLPGASP